MSPSSFVQDFVLSIVTMSNNLFDQWLDRILTASWLWVSLSSQTLKNLPVCTCNPCFVGETVRIVFSVSQILFRYVSRTVCICIQTIFVQIFAKVHLIHSHDLDTILRVEFFSTGLYSHSRSFLCHPPVLTSNQTFFLLVQRTSCLVPESICIISAGFLGLHLGAFVPSIHGGSVRALFPSNSKNLLSD